MPATVNLSTIPGAIERGDRYDTKSFEICGSSLGRETVAVATIADLHAAIQAFGARVRAAHPDASFLVSISVRKGDRKPRGFDAAYHANGFGQENYLNVIDKRSRPPAEVAHVGVVAAASTEA